MVYTARYREQVDAIRFDAKSIYREEREMMTMLKASSPLKAMGCAYEGIVRLDVWRRLYSLVTTCSRMPDSATWPGQQTKREKQTDE
jgi:hypothetical protein